MKTVLSLPGVNYSMEGVERAKKIFVQIERWDLQRKNVPNICNALTLLFQVVAARKLSAMYLIDSIIKNLPKSTYPALFANNIPSTFCNVFEKVSMAVFGCLINFLKKVCLWNTYAAL